MIEIRQLEWVGIYFDIWFFLRFFLKKKNYLGVGVGKIRTGSKASGFYPFVFTYFFKDLHLSKLSSSTDLLNLLTIFSFRKSRAL